MENKKAPDPARKGRVKSVVIKIITFFTCVVLVLSSLLIYSANYDDGYKYYQTLEESQVLIGQTLDENFLDKVLQQEQERLENDGYYIVSLELNPDIQVDKRVIKKSTANDEELKNNILDCFQVEVLLTKLTIKGKKDVYYFKTEDKCQTFVSEMNKISKIETTIEGTTGSYELVTSQDILDALKADHKAAAEAAKKKAELEAARKKATTTSRGGTSSRTANKKCPVLASYVYISSYYGPRWGSTHTGVDYAAYYGTSIYSWKAGTVKKAGWNGGYGNFIEVDHGDGTVSRYAHCSKIAVSVGQKVSKGQTIGYVGSTGNSTGNHLHFEIKVNGKFVNPLNYL